MNGGKQNMSKRSHACEISQKTKKVVWDRDNNRCVYCGKYVPMACANAHFIKRSQGGLGIPENIVTLCPECHYQEDHGLNTQLYIEKYLKNVYGLNWNKEKLIYKKY